MRKEFIYKDAEGNEIFKKVKVIYPNRQNQYCIEVKTEDVWTRSRDSFSPLPYNLEKFRDYQGLIICEGEKDADNVNELGIQYRLFMINNLMRNLS